MQMVLKDRHVGAADTLAFINTFTAAPVSILDVGCGSGVLARQLMDHGFQVTAIDRNVEAVTKANALGVAAEQADFLEAKIDSTFDVVLFSRVLHHIQPIELAVSRAHSLLKESGLLVVEDFGAELLDEKSAIWFFGLKAFIAAGGAPLKSHGPVLEEGQIPINPVQSWQQHHFGKHGLTESGAIVSALKSRFDFVQELRVPYLYRYLLDDVSVLQGESILKWESALCKAGVLTPIGLRIVAKKKV